MGMGMKRTLPPKAASTFLQCLSETRETGQVGLRLLDIRCLLQPQSDHTDGWHVLIHPV